MSPFRVELVEMRDMRIPLRVYVGGARAEMPRIEAFIARVKAAGHVITHDWTVFARKTNRVQVGGLVWSYHEPPMSHDERFAAWKASLDGIRDADVCVFLAPRASVTRGMWAELGACQAEGSVPIYVGHDDDTIATSMAHVVADDDAAFAALEAM